MKVTRLRCEYQANPIGIDTPRPRLSWQSSSAQRNAAQIAFQIVVAQSATQLEAQDWLWDSGRVNSSSSLHHLYSGPTLSSRQRYFWRVRIWDAQGVLSPWSETAWWEMGQLAATDWQAQWIGPGEDEITTAIRPCPLLRAEFTIADQPQSARLYVASRGLYLAYINGQIVSNWQFTPGWTSYQHRLQYQTYDVTNRITPGANGVGVMLGDGWYRGYLGFKGERNHYGERLAVLCQLHLTYPDGHEELFVSDQRWRWAIGPIQFSDIYQGETYDARLERLGWSCAGHDIATWQPVRLETAYTGMLVAQAGPPVQAIEELQPVAILAAPSGESIVDFGQNLVGRVRLRVAGPAGIEIVLRHAEVLDAAGNIYTTNLRSATQTDHYILRGEGIETYEPHFTFHGFRYVAVQGWPGQLTPENFTGVVLHSNMESTGSFECSHPLINQLQHNIVWGQKGNFLDVPTDCPQRDERLGWTGDAQVFIRTAAFNYNVAGFFTKWLRDLAVEQGTDGAVPHVIPNTFDPNTDRAATGWADAAVICPWTLYQCYGDQRILEEQYPSMKAWVEYMQQKGKDGLLFGQGFQFGDWLALDQPLDGARFGATDCELIGTAFFANSAQILAETAHVLGRRQEAQRYRTLARKIKRAFQREFLTPHGRLASNTQTAYVLALMFNLLPTKYQPEAVHRLVADIQRRGNHLATGFLGTPYLCHVLSAHGYLDVAYALLLQEEYPSWLYPVKHGATTIWERWDGIKPDGSFQDPTMNSFNHYAYGAIGDWLYRVVAGLDTDTVQTGYQRAIIRPRPGGGLTYARASLETLIGRYTVAWQLTNQRMHIDVHIPTNGQAQIHLPAAQLALVTENSQPLNSQWGESEAWQAHDSVILETGAGTYHFAYSLTSQI